MASFQSIPVRDLYKLERITTAQYDLYRAGFNWISNNFGVHIQVVYEGRIVADYWPTTKRLNFRKVKGFDKALLHSAVERDFLQTRRSKTK